MDLARNVFVLASPLLHFPFNTLIDGSDYVGGSLSVTFPAGVNVMSFNVSIINDNIAELAESFTLDLVIPAASAAMGVIAGSPDTATVNIMDDEGELNSSWLSTSFPSVPCLMISYIFHFSGGRQF